MKEFLIIACRHGDYAGSDLTEYGKQQSTALGESIKQFVGRRKPVVYASPLPRAQQTASLIAGIFKIEVVTGEVLEGDESWWGSKQLTYLLSETNRRSAVVAVTHFDAPRGIVNAALDHFKHPGRLTGEGIEKGTALTFSSRTGAVLSLPTAVAQRLL